MRHLLLSSRCLQGRPPGPDTKRLLGRHRCVTHLSDTVTVAHISERLDASLELMTRGANPQRGGRVLVVGDATTVAELIRCNVVEEGCEVFSAGSDAEALERVREVRPDVVVVDSRVPRLDGWEVCRRLKADPATRTIAVIMIAGRVEDGDKALGFEGGADAVVILP